jgi:DNA primase
VRIAGVPQGKDPCDYLLAAGGEAFGRVLAGASDALEHKWRLIEGQIARDGATVDQQRASAEAFLETVATAWGARNIDPIRRGLLTERMAGLLRVAPQDVSARLVQLARRRRQQRSPAGGRAAAAAEPRDAWARAECELLEVLLNAPDFLERIEPAMPADQYRQPEMAAVADRLYEHIRRRGAVDLAELMTVDEDRRFSQIVTDLAAAGEQKGNFEATVAGALACIEAQRHRERTDEAKHAWQSSQEDERLRRLHEQLKEHQGTQDALRKAGPKDFK